MLPHGLLMVFVKQVMARYGRHGMTDSSTCYCCIYCSYPRGQKANSKFSELVPISRCHSYEISYKYIYQCTRCDFKYTYLIVILNTDVIMVFIRCGRHSKSVKLDTARCPHCFR